MVDTPLEPLVDAFYSRVRAIVKAARKTEARAGLGPSQLAVLGYLESDGPLSIADLAAREQVSHPTMSRLITGLERSGFVTKATSKADARSRVVAVTPLGKRKRSDAILIRRELVEFLARRLRRQTLAELVSALGELESAISDADQASIAR